VRYKKSCLQDRDEPSVWRGSLAATEKTSASKDVRRNSMSETGFPSGKFSGGVYGVLLDSPQSRDVKGIMTRIFQQGSEKRDQRM